MKASYYPTVMIMGKQSDDILQQYRGSFSVLKPQPFTVTDPITGLIYPTK
jgi:hypothetical protein